MKTTMIKKLYAAIILSLCFTLQAAGQDTFTPAENINPSHVYNTYAIFDGTNYTVNASFYNKLSDIASDLSGRPVPDFFSNGVYLRWFIVDASTGNYTPVDRISSVCTITPSFYESYDAGNYGKIFWTGNPGAYYVNYYDAGNQEKISSATVVFSSTGTDDDVNNVPTKYNIVCLLSTQQPQYGYDNNQFYVTSDPSTFQAAIVFDIVTESEIENMYTEGNETTAEVIEYTKIYEDNITLNLYDDDNESPQKLSTSENRYLANAYVKWYIVDANGNRKAFESAPFTYNEGATDYSYRPEGLIYNSATATTKLGYLDQWNNYDLPDNKRLYLNNIGVPVTNIAKGDKVVCLVAFEEPEMVSGYVVKEPDFNLKYVYTLETLDEALENYTFPDLSETSSINVHELNLGYGSGATSVDIDPHDYSTLISADFGNNKGLNDAEYLHIYFLDKDGNEITNVSYGESLISHDKTSYIGSDGYPEIRGEHGLYGYVQDSNYGAHLFHGSWENYPNQSKFTITRSEGVESFEDMKVVMVLSNDVSGISVVGGKVIANPTNLKSALVFSFITEGFNHYEGYANAKGDWDMTTGMPLQKTHEWKYTKYIKAEEGQKLALNLPFDRTASAELEPRGYFRWYNYDTDAASDNLSTNNEAGHLLFDYPTGDSKGLFAWNCEQNAEPQNYSRVIYNVSGSDWKGERIACDVSRYIDGLDYSGTQLLHEPTLSLRYIYDLRPATEIADEIKQSILNHAESVYEEHGYVSLGINSEIKDKDDFLYHFKQPGDSYTALRLELQYTSDYFFYNYKKSLERNENPQTTDFGTELLQAKNVVWLVFDSSGDFYKKIPNAQYYVPYSNLLDEDASVNGRMCAISLNSLNSKGAENSCQWVYIGEGERPADPHEFAAGNIAYIVAYLTDYDGYFSDQLDITKLNLCPVARFVCRFHDDSYPMSVDEIPEYRSLDYLNENFTHVATISFDNDSEGVTYSKPTYPYDNMTRLPSEWKRRNYGFVYPDLYKKQHSQYLIPGQVGLSPLHGDYGLYKSMNMPGVSESVKSLSGYQYRWWETDKQLYDRTYEMSGHSQYGYFLYVDASDESRQIAEVDFEGDLCAGSIIVMSAAVADMTYSDIKPQLMYKLYGIEEDGNGNEINRKLIHTFASGDFETVISNYSTAKWYQVFLRTSLQANTDVEKYSKFRIVIDNYCSSTEGADYCMDDIRIYTRNSKIEVVQTSPMCEGEEGQLVKLRMNYESLVAWMDAYNGWSSDTERSGIKNLYWRVYKVKADGSIEVVNAIYDNGDHDYGVVTVYRDSSKCPDGQKETDSHGELNYVIHPNLALPALADGERYFVSLAKQIDDEDDPNFGECTNEWSMPTDICSAYSDYFVMHSQGLEISNPEGDVVSTFPLACGATEGDITLSASLKIPDPVFGGSMTIGVNEGLKFKWEVLKKDASGNVESALTIAENANPCGFHYKESDHLSADGYLYLQLTPIVGEDNKFTVYSDKSYAKDIILCAGAMEVKLSPKSTGPVLHLGFSDVNYPANNVERVVRVGLEQLEDINDNKHLIIPVHSYRNMNESVADFNIKVGQLDESGALAGNEPLVISGTNDPLCSVGTTVGNVVSLDSKNVVLSFTDIDNFHEGYWYQVNFNVYEPTSSGTICYTDIFFTMKIVPEYVTWTGAASGSYSTNWNNDENWSRSDAAYIYNPAGYEDYGVAGTQTASLTHTKAYVPMKFTKVTVDPRMQSARLEVLKRNGEGIVNNGLLNLETYPATTDIEYDLMVKVKDELTGTDYDCEKWYGNTCKEIYFKPQAELRYQQNLTYDRAWVEYELEQNKWYMLTSPLKEVYAGDMYVPVTIDNVAKGRQETPAFENIAFDKTGDQYSRTKYPIYQRSWDKSNSMVRTANTDIREDYDAWIKSYGWNADYDEGIIMESQWSHTYNDVTVPYTPNAQNAQNGFSLKADKVEAENTDKTTGDGYALIRVPKADEEFTYYDYNDDDLGENKRTATVDKTGMPNLLVDNTIGSDNAVITMPLSNDSGENGYYLVSNPYMASLNMSRFFEANPSLEKKFWIVSAGTMYSKTIDGTTNWTIAPTQAFFVKLADNADATEVTFNTNMITRSRVDLETGNSIERAAKFTEAAAQRAAVSSMKMTASHNGKRSTATVMVDVYADEDFHDSEDVETLYDSNLADVPTLYTVAGTQAATVNALPQIGMLPVGIVCSEDVAATVTFSGVGTMGGEMYLIDVQSGESTPVDDGTSVTMQANAHGRYYISTRPGIQDDVTGDNGGVSCYSPERGLLVASSAHGLQRIDIYSLDGVIVKSESPAGNMSATMHLPAGVYVVKVMSEGKNEAKTVKVRVQ